jgi:hypothetical protein
MRRAAFCWLLVAACGSDDSSAGAGLASCTVSVTAFDATTIQLCVEASGSSAAQLQQSCASQGANLGDAGTARVQHSPGPCSRVDALGGCRFTQQGTTATTWYYRARVDGGPEQTSADIELLCSQIGATFVPP